VWKPVGPDGPHWLFLDEPVASLDIGYQLTVMRVARAYADAGGGVVAVMHDLNLTAMFADAVALLGEGRVLGSGHPAEVLTDPLLSRAYRCRLRVNTAPMQGIYILPHSAGTA
jgi:iron complex transport system ATP-binding protein